MSRLSDLLPSSGGRRSGANVDVDPVLATILGLVIVGGGGLAAYGASQDTDPQPAPAPVVQNDDPVVERAIAIVQQVDGTATAGGEGVSSADQRRADRRARAASERGRSTDPFAAIERATETVNSASAASSSAAATTTPSTGSASTTGSSAGTVSAAELARRARAQAASAGAASAGGSTGKGGATSAAAPKVTATRATGRRAAATKPAKLTIRIADRTGRVTRSKRSLGYLVPNASRAVARVVGVSSSNEVVVLRLARGAALTGEQSPGTRCVKRRKGGGCELVRVRTGRAAVIRAADTPAGRRGPVTAVRILTIWRGGYKMAD